MSYIIAAHPLAETGARGASGVRGIPAGRVRGATRHLPGVGEGRDIALRAGEHIPSLGSDPDSGFDSTFLNRPFAVLTKACGLVLRDYWRGFMLTGFFDVLRPCVSTIRIN